MKRHMINIVLPISLFCIFAFCSFILLINSVETHNSIENKRHLNYVLNTPLSYISNKIRGSDVDHAISIVEIEDVSCLKMELVVEDQKYANYIYSKDSILYELLIPSSREVNLNEGNIVMKEVGEVVFKEENHQIISTVYYNSKYAELKINLRSQ